MRLCTHATLDCSIQEPQEISPFTVKPEAWYIGITAILELNSLLSGTSSTAVQRGCEMQPAMRVKRSHTAALSLALHRCEMITVAYITAGSTGLTSSP